MEVYQFASVFISREWSDKRWQSTVTAVMPDGSEKRYESSLRALNSLGKAGYQVVASFAGPSASSGGTGASTLRERGGGFLGTRPQLGGSDAWTSTDWMHTYIIMQRRISGDEIATQERNERIARQAEEERLIRERDEREKEEVERAKREEEDLQQRRAAVVSHETVVESNSPCPKGSSHAWRFIVFSRMWKCEHCDAFTAESPQNRQ